MCLHIRRLGPNAKIKPNQPFFNFRLVKCPSRKWKSPVYIHYVQFWSISRQIKSVCSLCSNLVSCFLHLHDAATRWSQRPVNRIHSISVCTYPHNTASVFSPPCSTGWCPYNHLQGNKTLDVSTKEINNTEVTQYVTVILYKAKKDVVPHRRVLLQL